MSDVKSKRMKTWKKVLLILGSMILAILVVVGGFLFGAYQKLNDSVQSEDFSHYMSNDSIKNNVNDPLEGRALNYLLIGSDSRESDEDAEIGGQNPDGGMRSDTTMVVHISKDRKFVDVVSIPRDSMVTIPSCKLSDGSQTAEESIAQFNSAFSKGDTIATAVACTASTIEKNTGINIDGYATVDFSGFQSIIDDLGGITIDVPYDMVSQKANLNLKKGRQKLNGEQALAYVRARTFEVGGGDGSDISRITRQQDFMNALIDQILNSETLTNPTKSYTVAQDILKSLTVSPEIGSANKAIGLLYSLKNIDRKNINFYTIPNTAWTQDPNRVIWTDDAQNYWNAMNNDTPIKPTDNNTEKTNQ